MVTFDLPDGSRAVSANPALAVMQWYAHEMPRWSLPEPLKPLTVYQAGPACIPSPEDANFLMLVIAAIERKFGICGVASVELSGGSLNERCLGVLQWLESQGDILNLNAG